MKREKKFGGRPGRKPKSGERVHLGFRVTPELKNRLETVAHDKGRSQSQEAELRLERSFDREDLLVEVLKLTYGPELAGILLSIGSTLQDIGPQAGFAATSTLEGANGWTSQPYAYDQAIQGVNRLLEEMRPTGDPSVPQSIPDELKDIYQLLGVAFANGKINALCGRAATAKEKADADKIRPLLGSIVERISVVPRAKSMSVGIIPKKMSAGKRRGKT